MKKFFDEKVANGRVVVTARVLDDTIPKLLSLHLYRMSPLCPKDGPPLFIKEAILAFAEFWVSSL